VAGSEKDLRKAAELLRASLTLADVAAPDGARHDPVRLAAAYRQILGGFRGVASRREQF
jgi:hypothetical protein